MVALIKTDNQIAQPQKSNEWYTPRVYTEAAREVMNGIDLDPASCEVANQVVKATIYYDIHTNGLDKPWHGNVWLNPPFTGNFSRKIWTQKLLAEYREGRTYQAILLIPVALDTQWFQDLWQFPICFPAFRIYFYQEKTHHNNPNFGVCFVYLGSNEEKFIEVFSQFGTIAKRVSPPKLASTTLWEVR